MPNSGHMTFVDQPDLFVKTVDGFLHGAREAERGKAH
jgi:pimeloyl-ACP methyl ester carboxylesterase